MLSILILSPQGEGYEIASKLVEEHHLVKMWVEEGRLPSSSIQQVDRYEEHLPTADLVIDATSRYGGLCEELRERGKVVMGGRVQELLAYDQEYAQQAAKLLLELEAVPDSPATLTLQFGGWFNGSRWLGLFCCQEQRRLLDQEHGPLIGHMGGVAWSEESPILEPLTSLLAKGHARGLFTVDVAVSETGFTFRQFHTSLDNSAIFPLTEAYRGGLGEMLYQVASSRQVTVDLKGLKYLSVKLMSLGPQAILRMNSQANKHFLPSSMPEVLGYVTAAGEDVREARRRAYRTINNITSLDCVYRNDIGIKGDTICH